ncbi:MAG: protein kinase domain-containing protein, partial [Planctomycetota bacterium]
MSGGGSHPYGGGPGGGPPWPPPPYGSPPSGAYDPRHGQGGAKPPPAPHGGYVPQSSGVFDPRAQGPRQSSSAPYHRHPQSYGAPPSYPGAAFDPHGQSLGPGSYPGATPSHHGGSAPWGFPGGGAHQASSHGSWPQPPPSPGMEATLVGAPAPGTLRVGSAFGPYLLQAELGRGGMGVVYTAFHQKLNRKCALKTLLPHMVGPDGGERFVSEGRAAASLKKHPNVVQVFDAGVIDGTPYLAMEFVPGEPLDAMIKRRGQVPENQLLEIGHKVALALDHA